MRSQRHSPRAWRRVHRRRTTSTRKAASAAALSAGVGAVVKMCEHARGSRADGVPAVARRRSHRARRVSSRACRRARAGSGRAVDIGVRPEHRVGLIEHEHGAVLGTERQRAARYRRGRRPSRTRNRSPRLCAPPRGRARAATSPARRDREWWYTATSERARRQPSMIDAWLSSSEHTSVPRPPNAARVPMFAANPVGNTTADSSCFHAASSCFELGMHRTAPTMRRAEPLPAPSRSSAAWAAAITSGWCVRPR